MIIKFDPKSMHVHVLVGTQEEYRPTEKIKLIQELVDDTQGKIAEFRKKVDTFRADVVEPATKKIQMLVDEINDQYTVKKEDPADTE